MEHFRDVLNQLSREKWVHCYSSCIHNVRLYFYYVHMMCKHDRHIQASRKSKSGKKCFFEGMVMIMMLAAWNRAHTATPTSHHDADCLLVTTTHYWTIKKNLTMNMMWWAVCTYMHGWYLCTRVDKTRKEMCNRNRHIFIIQKINQPISILLYCVSFPRQGTAS